MAARPSPSTSPSVRPRGSKIRPTGSIRGIVKTAGGAIDEMKLELRDAKTGFSRFERRFRSDGRFSFPDLPAGSFTLTVGSTRGKKQQAIELAEGEQKTGVVVELDALVTVTGRVVDMVTRQPVAGMFMFASIGKDGHGGMSRSLDDDESNITGADGRFTIKDAPVGPVALRGFPNDYGESPYSRIEVPRVLDATGTVDVGDLEALERRVKRGEKAGELGVRWEEPPPGTALDARTLKVSYIDPAGPAAKTELQVDDVVTAIDGVDVKGANSQYARTLLRAPPATKLRLTCSADRRSRSCSPRRSRRRRAPPSVAGCAKAANRAIVEAWIPRARFGWPV